MVQPLALVLFEKILPGGQLVNRLQDRGYRVQTIEDPARLLPTAEEEKPLLVLADLEPQAELVCAAIARLRHTSATTHLPVIAFAGSDNGAVLEAARAAGANVAAHDQALLMHLDQFLDQALALD